jgi:hypothetical protein
MGFTLGGCVDVGMAEGVAVLVGCKGERVKVGRCTTMVAAVSGSWGVQAARISSKNAMVYGIGRRIGLIVAFKRNMGIPPFTVAAVTRQSANLTPIRLIRQGSLHHTRYNGYLGLPRRNLRKNIPGTDKRYA